MEKLLDAAKEAHVAGKRLGHDVQTETKVKLGALFPKGKKS